MSDAPGLKPEQKKWLTKITGSKAIKEARAATKARAAGADLVEAELANSREMIREGQTYTISKMPTNAVTKLGAKLGLLSKMKSLDPKSDPIKEIDAWHDLPGSKSLTPDEQKAVLESMKAVLDIQEKLKNIVDENGRHAYQPDPTMDAIEREHHSEMQQVNAIKDKAERKRAFDKAYAKFSKAKADHKAALPEYERRLAEDLWQPLKREGILPENAIPDAYSEVARTFGASSELYQDRLEDYSKSLNTPKKILNKLKPVALVTEGLLESASAFTVAGAGIEAAAEGASKIRNSASARDTASAAKILDLTKLCVSSVRIGAEKAIEARDAHGVVDAFNAAVTGVIKQAFGKDTANLVGSILTAGARGARVADHLRKGEPDKAFEAFGAGIAASFNATGDDNFKKIGGYVAAGFKSLALTAKGLKNRNPEELLAALMTQAVQVGNAEGKEVMKSLQADTVKKINADDTIDKEEKNARIKWVKSGSTDPKGASDVEKGVLSAASIRSIETMVEKSIDKDALKKQIEKASEQTAQEMADFLLTPDNTFEEMLINGFSEPTNEAEQAAMDIEKKLNSIERVIAVNKRNQQIFELSKNIVNGGAGFVASLLPIAGIAPVATQLIFSFLEAAKHARQLHYWRQNVKEASKAGTVQMDAMMNRRGLEISQNIQADIKVALQAAELVGAAMETAAASGVGGPVGAIGTAIKASAKGTQGLMQVAVTVKTEIDMARAWRTYKKALETPQDRKLARKALRDNPTLAKYAIAYGAVVDKNPVAQKALRRCGINAKTLADSGTNTKKVVEYLELIYKEDPVLLRSVPVKREWFPGNPDLTVTNFNRFFLMGTTKAKPKVAKGDVSKINVTLATLEKLLKTDGKMLQDDYEVDEDSDLTMASWLADAANAVVLALSRYSPMDQDGKTHEEMAEYIDSLSALAELKRGRAWAIEEEIRALMDTAED